LSFSQWTPRVMEELFRRLVLKRLVAAERLSEEFQEALLGWVHSGFAVHGERVVWRDDPSSLERLARYALRAPMPFDAVELHGSKVRVKTPPEPRTGERDLLLDPLDWIHAVALQVPDPRRHLVRYYGVYANRSRRLWQGRARGLGWGATPGEPAPPVAEAAPSPGGAPGSRTGSWARLLRRILEVDPLLCPRCGVEIKIVSVITDSKVVDAILRSLSLGACRDPFAERGPPAPAGVVRPRSSEVIDSRSGRTSGWAPVESCLAQPAAGFRGAPSDRSPSPRPLEEAGKPVGEGLRGPTRVSGGEGPAGRRPGG
jgi:hypothetical protein